MKSKKPSPRNARGEPGPANPAATSHGGGTRQWLKGNLVAIGSVAVLTVYAAGYQRTRAAAQRFSGDFAERRPPVPAAPVTKALADTTTASADSTARRALTDSHSVVTKPATGSATGTAATAAAAAVTAKTAATHGTTATSPSKSLPDSTTAHAATPGAHVADSTPAPTPAAQAAAAVTTPATGTSATSLSADSTQAADKPRALWKDGTYSGWGTSRHGDIEAGLDIKDGKIIAAYITQCLTRYSCSRISRIIPQVVERQSPEVDFVSGATQSTNAFYYAIVEALSKAK